MVRYQSPSAAARANIGAHEFGHHLGMGHAGGNGLQRSLSSNFVEYGDPSAVMGNDASAMNSFTAPTRFYLGTLPEASVTVATANPVTLRALALGPDQNSNTFLALAIPCSACTPRVSSNTNTATQKELWITFRGDSDTCNPEHVPGNSAFRCHRDHAAGYNHIYIHLAYHVNNNGFRYPGPTTEKWYWISQGETYTLPTGNMAISACTVSDDTAIVAVGSNAQTAEGKCPGNPPAPPSPPAPPPGSPPPCVDGNPTNWRINNQVATCQMLAAYCQHQQHGAGIRADCPATCLVCTHTHSPHSHTPHSHTPHSHTPQTEQPNTPQGGHSHTPQGGHSHTPQSGGSNSPPLPSSSSPPPSPPPPTRTIQVNITCAGNQDDFAEGTTARSELIANFALQAGVSAERVGLSVLPASVLLVFSVETDDAAVENSVRNNLNPILTSASAATSILRIDVTGTPQFSVFTSGSPNQPGFNFMGVLWMPIWAVGAIVGSVLLAGAVASIIICCCCQKKDPFAQRQRQPQPSALGQPLNPGDRKSIPGVMYGAQI